MDLFATGSSLQPGLPARTGDAAMDGDATEKMAVFAVFLDLALSFPSPDAVIASGPEGEIASPDDTQELEAASGNPAMLGGKILPGSLPVLPPEMTATSEPISDVSHSTKPLFEIPSVKLAVKTQANAFASAPNGTAETVAPIQVTLPALDAAEAEVLPRPSIKAPLPTTDLVGAVTKAIGEPAKPQAPLQTSPTSPAPVVVTARPVTPVITVLSDRERGTARMSALPARSEAEPAAEVVPSVRPSSVTSTGPVTSPARTSRESAKPLAVSQFEGSTGHAEQTAERVVESLQAVEGETAEITPRSRSVMQPLSNDGVPVQFGSVAPITVSVEPRTSDLVQAAPSAPARPTEPASQEFGDIVERLARAREAEQSELVRATVSTREFGSVSMQMRTVEGRLHVAMTNADPGFAPAVQAASAMTGAGQQPSSDASSQQQSQSQQTSLPSGSGQSAPDSQSRQQQAERPAQQQPEGRFSRAPASSAKADEPRPDESGAIYA